MGRLKKEETIKDVAVISDLDKALNAVTKDFGSAICSGDDFLDKPPQIISWSPAHDTNLGGVPEGTWVSISGVEKLGKTTNALALAASAQQEKYGSRHVFFYDIEHRLKEMHLKGIEGLKTDKQFFHLIRSEEGKILSGKNFLEIALKFLNLFPRSVHIFDSLSTLTDDREIAGGLGTEMRGAGNKLISQFVNLATPIVAVNRQILIGILHVISNTSGYGESLVEKASRRWLYQSDIKIRGKGKGEDWMAGDDPIGKIITWKVFTSALEKPGNEYQSYLRYGVGIDKLYELIEIGKDCGLILTSGSWYTLSYLEQSPELLDGKPVPKVQGGEGLYQIFKDNLLFKAKLQERIEAMLT